MAWWDTSWPYRNKINTELAEVLVSESDFVYYYPLSKQDSDYWTDNEGVGDIRVTEGETTQIPHFTLDFIDNGTSGTGALFFKGTTDSLADKDYYIYYGNSLAVEAADTDTYGKHNVGTYFDHHHPLNEAANTTTNGYKNSAGSTDHLTAISTVTSVSGKLEHNAVQLDGTSDYLDKTSYTYKGGASAHEMFFMMWIKKDVAADTDDIVSFTRDSGTDEFVRLENNTASNQFLIWKDCGSSCEESESMTNTALNSTDWVFLAVSFDSLFDVGTLFINDNTSSVNFTNTGIQDNGSTITGFRVGAASNSGERFDGAIQSVFYANAHPSDNLVLTYYNNQSDPDSFWTVGGQENQGPTVATYTLPISQSASVPRNAYGAMGHTNPIGMTARIDGELPEWTLWKDYDFSSSDHSWVDGGSDVVWGNTAALATCGCDFDDNNNTGGSWQLRDNSIAASRMTSPDLDLTPYSEIRIDIAYQTDSMESGEDFFVQFTDSGGLQTIGTYVSGTDFGTGESCDLGTKNIHTESITIVDGSGGVDFESDNTISLECSASTNADAVYIGYIQIYTKT